jgi:hypothetical protein
LKHLILTSVKPIDIYNLHFLPINENKLLLGNLTYVDIQNWVSKQTRYDMVFYINPSSDVTDDQYHEFLKILENKIKSDYYHDFEFACELFAPLLKNERLFVNVILTTNYRQKDKLNVSYNIKTETCYNNFFGFDLNFNYHKLNGEDYTQDYMLSQYSRIVRQQVFNSNFGFVIHSCPSLGFNISHTEMSFDDVHSIVNFFGFAPKHAIPKVCSSCKYYCHDSLETCVVNLDELGFKIKASFECKDYEFDTDTFGVQNNSIDSFFDSNNINC